MFLPAATVAADTVFLKNGDRISGRLVLYKGGSLELATDYTGTVKIPGGNVSGIASDGPVTVRFDGGGYRTGRVEFSGGVMRITSGRNFASDTIDFASVSEMYPGTDVPRGLQWTGRINVGASRTAGNTDKTALHVDGAVTARSDEDRVKGRLNFNREITNGERTEDDYSLLVQHDHFVSQTVYFYTNGQVERDQPADLRLRTVVGTGLGYQVYESARTNLSLEAGPAYSNEDYFESKDRDFVAGRWAIDFDHYVWDDLAQLFHRQEGILDLEDTSDLLVRTSTGVRVPLGNSFNMTAQADIDWDNRPAPGEDKTEKKYLLTVGYSW